MKKALLFILIFGLSPFFVNAQMFEDICADAELATSEPMSDGTPVTVLAAITGPTNDPIVEPTTCGVSVVSDMYFLFNVPTTGSWEIVIDGDGVATGMYCATFGEDCASMMDMIDDQDLNPSITTSCMELTGGTDYIIGLHVEAGGAADIIITLNEVTASNDLCGTATTIDNAGLTGETNDCSSIDADVPCDGTTSLLSVWYEYTVPADVREVEISITEGSITSSVFAAYDGCTGNLYETGSESCDQSSIILNCPTEGDVINILVGSTDGNVGDFDLSISETATVDFDTCEDPKLEGTLNDNCTITNISGDNTDACPEAAGLTTCSGAIALNSNPVTWHEITLPANTEELILETINSGNIEISIFTDCPDSGGATTGGVTCVSSAPTIFSGLTAGDTYFIAVASTTGLDGPYDFDLLAVTAPDNDDCNDAADLSGGSLTGQSNECASAEAGEPFGTCGGNGDDVTVWYQYDLTNDVQDLTISLTDNGISNHYLIAYDACGGNMIEEDCGGTVVVIDCPVNPSSIWIQVGSEFDDAGGFDISVTEGSSKETNDECDNPEALTINDACVFETMSVTTTNMCPEVDGGGNPSDLGTGCNYSDDATSWFSFTTTMNTSQVEFDGFTANGVISVFENDCPVGTVVADCVNSNTIFDVTGNTTFLIAATIPGSEGDFTFDIKFIEAPENDDCTDAEPIPTNGSLATETNSCASTEGGESFSCTGATDDATVWYTYDVTNDIQDLTISLTAAGISNNYLIAYDGCGGSVIEEDCGGTEVVIDCPINGSTIIIQVGSLLDDAGEFDISVSEGDPKISNDECDAPIDVTPGDVCVFETMTVSTTDACPEVDNVGNPSDLGTGCNYSDDATSWFSFTTSASTIQVEFDNFTNVGSISIFSDACPVTTIFENCISGNTLFTLPNPGTVETFLIAATIAGSEGDFDFDIKFVEPPYNDLCADAPTLSIGTTLSGESTVCATSDLVGNCDPNATSSVWYTYTVPAGGHNELTIDIENFVGDSDDFNVFAINGGCGSTTPWTQADGTTADYCGGSGTELITLSCLEQGDEVTIVVASDPTNEGTFDITLFDETTNADFNATCLDNDLCATADNSLGTITTNDAGGEACITDCNTLACPDAEIDALCGGTVNNAVFFEFTTDNDALLSDGTQVFLQVSINNSCGALNIAVLEGSCGAYTSFPPIGCLTTDNSGNVDVTGILDPNTTYTVVVGTNDNVGCGDFDLCVQITTGCANDDCVDAITLADGVQLPSQNTGCTLDPTAYNCAGSEVTSAWYSFTLPPGTGGMEITITPGTFAVQVFDGTAGCPPSTGDIVPDGEFCVFNGTEQIDCLQAGTLFFIQVSTDGVEVAFDITITALPSTITNDDCVDATVIPTNGTISTETNECASSETGESFNCGGADNDATVWYTYEVTNDIQDLTINLTQSGITSNYLVAYDDCGGALVELDCDGTEVIIDCPLNPSTILIQVGSLPDDAGEFDITVTEGDDKDSNDECDAPIDISPVDICLFETMSVTTLNMCPEVDGSGNPSDLGTGCNYSDDATSWFSITTMANTTQVELDNFTNSGVVSVFENGCPVGTVVADCVNSNTIFDVTGNTTFLIAATVPGTEGDFDFDIKFIESPYNDDCADAPELVLGNTLTDESTICATSDITGLCNPSATSTVWYTYTVPAGGHNELTIDIENFVGNSDDLNVFAINGGCGGTTLWSQADATNADYCGVSGTELLTLSCLVEGDEVTIAVASSPSNEGTFDITINDETDNVDFNLDCLDNDLCADVDNSLGTIITNDPDGEACITDCNTLACPDDEINNLCGGTLFNAVFYEFTTDSDPLLSDGTQVFLQVNLNNSCFTAPALAVLEGSCGSYTSFTPIGCITTDNSGNVDVTGILDPNTTYTIVVGTTDNVGCADFDICVQISTGCANDDCVDAIPLDDGVQLPTQNTGCTMDAETFNCGGEEASSAWYSFTMPAGMSTMEIAITGGTFAVQVFENITGCPSGAGDIVDDGEFCAFSGTEQILCLNEEVEYFIQVSTTEGSEVMFDITITGLPNDDAPFDVCSTAEGISNGPDCEWFSYCFQINKACPEVNNFGTACDFDQDGVVWATITLPSNATGIEFQDFDNNGTYVAMFENDCPPTTIFNGGACFSEADGVTSILGLTAGETFVLAIGNPIDGGYCFDIRLVVPPRGDDPCNNDAFTDDDVVDLGTGGSDSNTTCCAIGSTDDPNLDFGNQECASPDDDAVWYKMEIDPSQDGIIVSLTGGGSTNINMEVLSGESDAGCTGAFNQVLGSYCGTDNQGEIFITICDGMDPFIWVKVFTQEENCGTFDIDISHETGCKITDVCEESTGDDLSPVTDLNGEFDFVCTTGCMQFACPETTVGDCGFGNMPVVWFQVTPDDDAAQIYANIEVLGGSWTPVFAIYSGDCPDLTLEGTAATPGCSNAWPNGANTDQINQPVMTDVDTYWIAVGAMGDAQDINENPEFTICVATTINLIICLGDGSCNPAANFTLEDSDIEDQELGPIDPADAPILCQGETVEICSDFFYDASQTGVDWLIGIVPIFGDGWNLDDFDPSTADVVGNGITADWFDEGVPILQEFVGTICTYTDDNGVLQLCNVLCGTCPCTPGLPAGSELPGGWFWLSDGGAGCDNDGTPGEHFGIGSTQADVEFCFELTVREDFIDEAECNQADLSIGFQTFSDGVAGCWEDPVGECLLDEAQEITFNLQCNVPPEVWVEGAPCPAPDRICMFDLCTGNALDIDVQLEDGSSLDIVGVFDDLGTGVTGGNDFTFPGFGTIDDVLVNGTNSPQVVEYTMMSFDPGNICPGLSTTIEVTVWPEIEYDLEEIEECENTDDVSVTVNPNGGTGTYVDFEWSNGESTQTWILSQPIPDGVYNYNVTVTDDQGCTGTMDVEVTVHPEVIFDFEDGPTEFCQGDVTGNDCIVFFEATPLESGVDADDYFWTVDFTGLETDDLDEEELEIDVCNSAPGSYLITLEITDDNGCTGTNEFEITISEGPEANVTWLDQDCDTDDGSYDIQIVSNDLVSITIYDDAMPPNVVWGPTAFTGNETATVASGGTYTIELYDAANCLGTETIVIDPPMGTPIMISGNAPICVGETATIEVDNVGDYTSFAWSDANMTSTSSLSVTGLMINTIYVVTATDASGCGSTAAYEVIVNPLPIAQINGSFSFCTGSSTTLTATGGTGYNWTGPAGNSATDQIIAMAAGTYTVTVTDANNCTSTAAVDVIEDTNLSPNIAGGDICDGSTVTLDAGIFTSWEWSGPAGALGNAQTQEVSEPGIYMVEVADATGCMGSGAFEVFEFQTPEVTVIEGEACNIDTGNGPTELDLTTLVSGATGTFFNSDGSEVLNTVIDFAGPITSVTFMYVTNTATLPCVDIEVPVIVNVTSCDCPQVQTDIPDPLCSDQDPLDLTSLELAAFGDGDWFYSDGTPIPNEEYDPALGSGTVVFTLDPALQGGGSCDPDFEVMIVVENAVTALVDPGSTTVCNDGTSGMSTTVQLNDFVTGDVGEWQDPVGAVIANTLIEFEGVPVNNTVTYTYCTTGAIAPCENVCDNLVITVIDCDCPPVVTDEPDPLCNSSGGLSLLTLENNVPAGTWSVVDGPQVVVLTGGTFFDATGILAGSYEVCFTVDVPAGGGCPEQSCEDIVVSDAPSATVTPIAVVCSDPMGDGDTFIDFTALVTAGDMDGEWTDNNGTGVDLSDLSNVSFVGVDPTNTTYLFTYTTNSAISPCEDQAYEVVVTVSECLCPLAVITNPNVVCNDNDMLDLNDFVTTIETGVWTDEDGNSVNNILDITLFDATAYTYYFVLDPAPTDPECETQFPLILDVVSPNNPGEPNPDIFHICADEVDLVQLPDLIDPNSNPDVGGVWVDDPNNNYNGSPFDSNGATFDPNGQDAGTYLFTYGWTDNPPCDDVGATVTIIIDPSPTADAGPDGFIDCDTPEAILDGTSSTGVQPLIYQWEETTNGVTIANPNSAVITVTEPGTYVLEIIDNNECVAFDEASVTSDPNLPILSLESTSPFCPGDTPGSVTISDVQGGNGPFEYSIDGGVTWTTDLSFLNLSAGQYTVVLRDANGCTSTSTAIIEPPNNPIVDVEDGTPLIQLGDSYTITNSINFIEEDVVNMVWTADGEEIYSGPYTDSLMVTPESTSTVYCVLLTDVNGCTTTDCVTIRSQQINNVYIANVISTNSEAGNNSLYVQSPNVEAVTEFYVYDRWGELIFKIDEATLPNDPSVGWFGMFKEERVVDGVYAYLIRVKYFGDEQIEDFVGNVTVLH